MLISIHLVSFYFTLQLKKINNNVVQKQVNGSLLPASVISLYCAHMCATRVLLVNLEVMSAMVSTSPEL
jgi:hypothetical protein